jgi:hypothetical protein
MKKQVITFKIVGPILPGSVSTADSQCGKPKCACKDRPPKLHGTYYRWTGVIDGKRTTKTISKEVAKECERRIRNYRVVQQKLSELLDEALNNAPWGDYDK